MSVNKLISRIPFRSNVFMFLGLWCPVSNGCVESPFVGRLCTMTFLLSSQCYLFVFMLHYFSRPSSIRCIYSCSARSKHGRLQDFGVILYLYVNAHFVCYIMARYESLVIDSLVLELNFSRPIWCMKHHEFIQMPTFILEHPLLPTKNPFNSNLILKTTTESMYDTITFILCTQPCTHSFIITLFKCNSRKGENIKFQNWNHYMFWRYWQQVANESWLLKGIRWHFPQTRVQPILLKK